MTVKRPPRSKMKAAENPAGRLSNEPRAAPLPFAESRYTGARHLPLPRRRQCQQNLPEQ